MNLAPILRSAHRLLLLLAACGALILSGPSQARAEQVLVFAAASLKTALDGIGTDFAERTGHTALLSYGGSSMLARQIERGAPADVFISANTAWMDVLEEAGAIRSESRFDLASNRLVLVAHDGQAPAVDLSDPDEAAGRMNTGPLAMALVDAVPAGLYGKAALESLGLWEAVAPSVVQSDNVRTALALVARGEAPYGIVYASDAVAEPRVHVVATFPADSHPPIRYPAARMTGSDAAQAFLDFLSTDEARRTLEANGFLPIEE